MRNTQRGIPYLARLFAEYCTEQSFLGGKLGFALGRYLSYKYIARGDLCADADNAAVVKILKRVLADIRYISCYFLRPEFCIARFKLIFLNMNGGINIIAHQALVYKNRVLVVVAFPCHKADEGVSAEGYFAVARSRTVGNNLVLLDLLTHRHYRALIYTGSVV